MTHETLLFGWTFEQWEKAVEYCRLTDPETVTGSATEMFSGALFGDKGHWYALQAVRRNWRKRRADQPGGVEIEIAS